MSDAPVLANHFLVRSEHINAAGHLFGGYLMAEIDSVAYCLLRTRYPDCAFVTRAASIQFVAPAPLGSVVVFRARRERVGRTSVTVAVRGAVDGADVAHATMTFVRVVGGGAAPVPPENEPGRLCAGGNPAAPGPDGTDGVRRA